ncbi:hypothetical protein PR003_g16723 [Phytophthora rubi]|uniref:Reverse transcriptase Ty1/copia-type domain-containing protein n=1 Tax=Phytophthora rubi TaxID=129364 RepID=A0A6A3KEM1_9STRA|nr:hypothetical protein PR002_g16751 [Phytophthora rubi]KAE9006435.1 hypothetical protein PR001_g17211 [Phytophthora rubi]KAE9324481.1 hypothetical protein PR003_g16723 [Phytophthora rubi]
MYGSKQASRAWYENLTAFLISCGYTQCKADTCLFVKIDGAELTIVIVYADDMLMFGESDARMQYCPTSEMMAGHFTKPLGRTKFERFRAALGVRRMGVLEVENEKLL